MITPLPAPPSPHDAHRALPPAPACEFCADGKPCEQVPGWRAVRRGRDWPYPHLARHPRVLDVCRRHVGGAAVRGADIERLAPPANPG